MAVYRQLQKTESFTSGKAQQAAHSRRAPGLQCTDVSAQSHRHNFLIDLTTLFNCIIKRGLGYRSRYSDSPRDGRPGHRIPVEARFSAPAVHPASYKMGTGSFSRGGGGGGGEKGAPGGEE